MLQEVVSDVFLRTRFVEDWPARLVTFAMPDVSVRPPVLDFGVPTELLVAVGR